jgi:hypothetical protein
MTRGRGSSHVDADLGDDHLGAEFSNAGDGAHDLDRRAKRLDFAVNLPIDPSDGGVNRVDMLQEKTQHEAMMVGHPAAQRCLQFGGAGFDPAVGQGSQSSRVGFAGDHPTTGITESSLMLASSSVFWMRWT